MRFLELTLNTCGMPSWSLVKRKEVYVPTWRGWILTLLAFGGILLGGLWTIQPFLSLNRPVHEGILIVEGWLPDYSLEEAKRVFEAHPYRLLLVTGVPIDIGMHISSEKDYAQLGASTLQHLGLAGEKIVRVSCQDTPRNRTYATACRAQRWLVENAPGEPVDVFTLGAHSRRSWLLYRLALGPERRVGVVAGKDRRYDQKSWWLTSSGVRLTMDEAIAYLYAKFLFYPWSSEAQEAAAQ